ncbi:hypothetical protein ACSQ67_008823 [Phaseolus vulgaris]
MGWMGYNLLILAGVRGSWNYFLDWSEVEALGFGVVALVSSKSRTVGSGEESWAWPTTGWKIEEAWCGEWFPAGMALEIGLSRDAATEWDVEMSGFGAWITAGGALGSVSCGIEEVVSMENWWKGEVGFMMGGECGGL